MVGPWSGMPARWFSALGIKYGAQYNCNLNGNGCTTACVPTSASGEQSWQCIIYWEISVRWMCMVSGTHTSGIEITIGLLFNTKTGLHTIYFQKLKSLLKQYLDHSNKFVHDPQVVPCVGTSLSHHHRTHHCEIILDCGTKHLLSARVMYIF